MTVVTTDGAALIAAACAIAPRVRESREQIEQERRLPAPLVEAMADAGLFHAWAPRALGGAEACPATVVRAVEEVARADGAAGWNLAIGAIAGAFAAYLPANVAAEVFTSRRSIIAGSFNARGPATATVVEGGYRVSGRWAFVSGCNHATWLGGACTLIGCDGDDEPLRRSDRAPEPYVLLWPRADAQIIDTWHTGGLRGTGSHDVAVTDLFVPAERSFPLLNGRPCEPGALYRLPLSVLLAVPLAAVATGIARAAIDALVELAGTKAPAGSRTSLGERPLVQVDIARAEALLRSGRAFLFEAIAEAWDAVTTGDALPIAQRAMLRLAVTQAVASAAQAVDLMYAAGGGTSLYTSSPLERCFRDIHAVTQHATVATSIYERPAAHSSAWIRATRGSDRRNAPRPATSPDRVWSDTAAIGSCEAVFPRFILQ